MYYYIFFYLFAPFFLEIILHYFLARPRSTRGAINMQHALLKLAITLISLINQTYTPVYNFNLMNQ